MFIVAARKLQRKKIEQMRGRKAKTSFLLLKADLFVGPKVFTCFSPFKLPGVLSSVTRCRALLMRWTQIQIDGKKMYR